MGATADIGWLCRVAENLACEIMQQMSGIRLESCSPSEGGDVVMDAVCALVDGDYQMKLQFCAERRMFVRLARNMIGREPEDGLEVQEYAAEFFNVLCGRFISQIHQTIRTSAQFFQTQYVASPNVRCLADEGPVYTLYFVSEQQELAEFSWTKQSIESLLRRNEEK